MSSRQGHHGWRSMDAFAKPMDGLRNQTAVGGAITLMASVVACLLFLSQVWLYVKVDVIHSLHLPESNPLSVVLSWSENYLEADRRSHSPDFFYQVLERERARIHFYAHVTFAHLQCSDLDVSISGASLSSGKLGELYGRHAFSKRTPTEFEQRLAESGGKITSGNRHKLVTANDRGCTLEGSVRIPKTGGDFQATINPQSWVQATNFIMLGIQDIRKRKQDQKHDNHAMLFNLTHYIHDIHFGEPHHYFEQTALKGLSAAPSEYRRKAEGDNAMSAGVFSNQMTVKLVPTRIKRFARMAQETYQISVASHIVYPETLAKAQQNSGMLILPGVSLTYDLTPIAVHHTEQRDNIFVFLSSLVAIVGGVFVTVSLLSSCLVNSAAAVAKKID